MQSVFVDCNRNVKENNVFTAFLNGISNDLNFTPEAISLVVFAFRKLHNKVSTTQKYTKYENAKDKIFECTVVVLISKCQLNYA